MEKNLKLSFNRELNKYLWKKYAKAHIKSTRVRIAEVCTMEKERITKINLKMLSHMRVEEDGWLMKSQ